MKPNQVRTRFAPSPTGFMHVGGVRTALFAWLLARQADGQFILRIEDTDVKREISGSLKHIMDSLKWLGLDWDDGPLKQSERLDTYKQWAKKLVEKGRAYSDPYSEAELENLRRQAIQDKKPFLYRNHQPEITSEWDESRPLRFKSDPKPYQWQDEVMGKLESVPEAIDDFILIKSDGFPTYNFAHIIDDHEMTISHVIRSQEFLPSVPKFLNLYEALDFKPPRLATLPYVLGPDGKKKLSKRDGAKDILEYAAQGYLPEAMLNFLATLGWNDGSQQEIFSLPELIKKFSLSRVQKSGARFDEERLTWMNGAHIRKLPVEELYGRSLKPKDFWPKEAGQSDDKYKRQVLGLVQDRLKYLAELPQLTTFFFTDLPFEPELISRDKALSQLEAEQLRELLGKSTAALEASDFSIDDLTAKLNQLLESTAQKPRVLFSLIRIVATRVPASPGLAETLALLGKERTLARLRDSLAKL